MKILVLGGTRFFGIHMVNDLLEKGHEVTIATRGRTADAFGDSVSRICLERTDENSIREAVSGVHYDVIIDKIAYCSNDIRKIMDTAVYDPKHMDTIEYLKFDQDIDHFKQLHLLPMSESWSGSEIPVINRRIASLESIRDSLYGLEYIDHKAYIDDLIRSKEKYREEVKRQEYLDENGRLY